MAGRLLMLDKNLLRTFMQNKFKVAIYGEIDRTVQELANGGGLIVNSNTVRVIPVRCDGCHVWQKLEDAMISPRCPNCQELYWDADFAAALPALRRVDLGAMMDALTNAQFGCLFYPLFLSPKVVDQGTP